MATISKDLGAVTAYGFAKDAGYSGTSTDFATSLANIATIATSIDTAMAKKADLVDGKVPSSELPSYVDDVIEGYYNSTDGKFYKESTYTTEIAGETGKIYVDLSANSTYRWSGSIFVKISNPITDASDLTVNTITASTSEYPEPTATETVKVITGKIKKFLDDLKTKKADKVTSATNGHLAGLDSNGNLTDSGKSSSAVLPSGGTTGQVLKKSSGTDYAVEWGSAGSGGHTILNGSGSVMNQRSNLQFIGGNIKDDSSNDKTVVTVARELTQAEYDALSSAEKNNGTTYYIPDAPSRYTGVPQSMIGDAWVLGHAYAVGDYTIDANGLYKNGTAHTSTATNRPSVNQSGYWTLVSVASELNGTTVLYEKKLKYTTSSNSYNENVNIDISKYKRIVFCAARRLNSETGRLEIFGSIELVVKSVLSNNDTAIYIKMQDTSELSIIWINSSKKINQINLNGGVGTSTNYYTDFIIYGFK